MSKCKNSATEKLMPVYREIMDKVFNHDQHMVDYCVKKVDQLVPLDNGMFIEIEKKSIEKDFCFGYSDSPYDTEDYDRANRMASHARTSEDYFIRKNMESFQDMLDCIDGVGEYGSWATPIFCLGQRYYGQEEDSPFKSFIQMRVTNFLDAMGGSADLKSLKGKVVRTKQFAVGVNADTPLYVLTDKDLADIRAGYVRAMENHKKKVMAYLKRFGLKHVNSWSYWRDE